MDLSLIIPAYNEEESIPELVAWIKKSDKDEPVEGEVVDSESK